jgi:transglutaminase-like putative cysteine protease
VKKATSSGMNREDFVVLYDIRCVNIPARYCTGYLGDIGTPRPSAVGGFEAYSAGVGRCSIRATTYRESAVS